MDQNQVMMPGAQGAYLNPNPGAQGAYLNPNPGAQGAYLNPTPGAWSQTQDNTGDVSWLKQALLNTIVGYNKMIKSRTASKKAYSWASTKASNAWNKQNNSVPETVSGAEKRRSVILAALRSLENYPNIENAGFMSATSSAYRTTMSKMSNMFSRKTQGGKLRRGTRKHRKSRK
jgi:hypothetical protein